MSSDVQHAVPVAPAPPPQRRISWLTFAVGVVSGAALLGGTWGLVTIAGSTSTPDSFTLRGSMTLYDSKTAINDCRGSGGYSDIRAGASVTVYGASGNVVGDGSLGPGKSASSSCSYSLMVEDVPDGEKFYQVEVSHRGKITVTAEDAKAGLVTLSLGD
ncbi:hypothetical protein [Amycolatopsis sp. 195334CR]|uniref:hypothetical protein n=1 Tax=Amycolatopsis sp. 195334CR TaxID=2814588 RepID=UPI001A8FCA41|nr:hypothetical protein [Amycolatopsis sp. 195334CR]MBN6036484.1 hypothetical protein [Amycolatopsis sp. 195334CR]